MLPKVRTSDGFLVDWNKEKVTAQLIKESVLAKEFFGISPMTKKEADLVAHIVENRVISMNLPFVSSSVVRELVNNTLLELSASDPDFLIYKNVMTRVGTPVYDAYKIDVGDGFEKNENANLQSNPETIHKKKADLMSKEQYLLLMPPALANAHHNGDIHILQNLFHSRQLLCHARVVKLEICTVRDLSDELILKDADCSRSEFLSTLEVWYKNKPDWKGEFSEVQILTCEKVTVNEAKP